MVAMALQQQTALPRRPCCIEARDRYTLRSDHFQLLRNAQATIGENDITLDWTQRDVGADARQSIQAFGQSRRGDTQSAR